MRKTILFTLFAISISFSTKAQIEQIFAAANADASTYVEHYISPAINGLMYDLNSGWYSRSKTHKKFGFDVSFSASIAFIPDDEKYFQFVSSEYDNLTLNGGNAQLPTIAGDDTNSVLESEAYGNSFNINAIDGLGDNWLREFFIPIAIPTPMIQAGFGLPFKTDIKLRFFPNTEREGIAFNLFGVGLKHNLSQHFTKSDKDLFTISALGAFTNTNVSYMPNNAGIPGSNQSIDMSIQAYTAQAIAGINLKLVNFYLGFGYVGGTTELGVKGSYIFNNGISDFTVTDPIDLNFEMTGFKTTLGTRFNLGPVKIFGDYSIQKYPSVTAGIAVSMH